MKLLEYPLMFSIFVMYGLTIIYVLEFLMGEFFFNKSETIELSEEEIYEN